MIMNDRTQPPLCCVCKHIELVPAGLSDQIEHSDCMPSAGEVDAMNISENASRTWTRGHMVQGLILADGLLLAWMYGWDVLLATLLIGLTMVLAAVVSFRLLAVLVAVFGRGQTGGSRENSEELKVLATSAPKKTVMPRYTVLVPLFREEHVADNIVAAIAELDYPPEQLEVLLLLEMDDAVTRNAVARVDLPGFVTIVDIPPGNPRTKPKACNVGLQRVTGEFVVVYDAEDRPEPDQLRKVVAAFENLPENVACLQAKLNYYNPRENWLTKFFTIEYTVWFDLFLPGLQWLGGPIPLGGTSNHFRTRTLRRLGGWDAYNVTEDCDLGVRLSIAGYQTRLIDSTTWEEANTSPGNWIRQRSRWVKGYLQTHLVHTRSIARLLRSLGLWRTTLFLLTVSGNAVMQLLCIVLVISAATYLILLSVDVLAGRDAWTMIAGSRAEHRLSWKLLYLDAGEHPVWSGLSIAGFIATVAMLLVNGIFIAINWLGCRRRGYHDLWLWALLSPLYWLMASVAAWKGAIQLIHKPHYWEKTQHGLSKLGCLFLCMSLSISRCGGMLRLGCLLVSVVWLKAGAMADMSDTKTLLKRCEKESARWNNYVVNLTETVPVDGDGSWRHRTVVDTRGPGSIFHGCIDGTTGRTDELPEVIPPWLSMIDRCCLTPVFLIWKL